MIVLSNGSGEDAIAAAVLGHLRRLRPQADVIAFPLVGEGNALPADLPRWGGGGAPPSGGLSNAGLSVLWNDLRHGLLARVLGQLRCLRRNLNRAGDLTLAVGDLFPVVLAGLAGARHTLFVGTAKSVRHHEYSWPERLLLRRYTRDCAVRDLPTAEHLQSHGVSARYLGNAMLDEAQPRGVPLGLPEGPLVTLFPGSRRDAAGELPRLLQIGTAVPEAALAVAVADAAALSQLTTQCHGWSLSTTGAAEGRVGTLERPGANSVALVSGALGDLLARSQAALGQAGTAHEQAAAAGICTVSLHPDPKGKLGWYRGRQKGLLGECLWLVRTPDEAASALRRLLHDPAERERRGAEGIRRMGEPGGAARIAAWVAERL